MSKRIKKINKRLRQSVDSYPYWLITLRDFNWLVEQAEELQKLKEESK